VVFILIVGIGIDIVELSRIEKLVEHEKFINRILTKNEQVLFQSLSLQRRIEFLAGRFAAKEAYSKAKGTGIGKALSFQDIEILKDKNGKPFLNSTFNGNVHISISHSNNYAVAQIILESLSS
jgi:holo-[acyl-carrier protein] synthase